MVSAMSVIRDFENVNAKVSIYQRFESLKDCINGVNIGNASNCWVSTRRFYGLSNSGDKAYCAIET